VVGAARLGRRDPPRRAMQELDAETLLQPLHGALTADFDILRRCAAAVKLPLSMTSANAAIPSRRSI
jgi:hypothetical protein